MGRSVITHRHAEAVAYDTFGPDEEYYTEQWDELDEDDREYYGDFDRFMYGSWNEDAQYEWDDFKVAIQDRLVELWPSLEATDRIPGYWDSYHDEQAVIAENAHTEISISEYCGVVAISLAPRSDIDYNYADEESRAQNTGKHWRAQIAERFLEEFGEVVKIGTFSNGESVYQKVSA